MEGEIFAAWSPTLHSHYNMTKNYLGVVWSEKFWFPAGVGWSDMEDSTVRHPHVNELKLGLVMTLALSLLRFLLENYVFNRIALAWGLKYSRRAEPELVLDQFYSKRRDPSGDDIKELVRELNWTACRIQRWFRLKRNESQCKIKKFGECAWRLCFYTTLFFYGLWVLHDEPWAQDASQSIGIETWPHHNIKPEFCTYYMIELGYYSSLLLSLYTDVYRSDFKEQAIHHFATVVLIVFSWTANFVRIGMLVLTVHNAADSWLQMTKMAIYMKKRKLETVFMTLFTLIWLYSRVYLYPLYIVKPTVEETYKHWDIAWPCVLVLISCLVLLQLLHLIWTWYIAKTVYRSLYRGSMKDERSDDETDEKKDE